MSTIRGTDAADNLRGGADADEILGGDGDDHINGGGGSDTIYGGSGNDFLSADGYTVGSDVGSTNHLYGEGGDDSLYGDQGIDILDGGMGNDRLWGAMGDTLLGGDGDDTLTLTGIIMSASLPAGRLDGGAGNDKIVLNWGDYAVTGGSGADLFENLLGVWSKGYATITDFNAAEGDRLDIAGKYRNSEYERKLFRGEIVNPGFSLKTGQAFSANDYGPDFAQVWTWFDGSDTYLLYDVDGSTRLSDGDIVMRFIGKVALDARAFVDETFTFKVEGTDGADVFTGTNADDDYRAVNGDDQLHGGDGDDALYGGNGADRIWGDDGDDFLQGGLGDDVIDGGAGTDRASYFGYARDYAWTRQGDGSWQVTGPDGTDTLWSIEGLVFLTQQISLLPKFTTEIAMAFTFVLRHSGRFDMFTDDYTRVGRFMETNASTQAVINEIIDAADATTSVASMSYQFFTGKVPTAFGVDYLVSPKSSNPANLNSDYYAKFDTVNRYINFAVNLGKNGEAKDSFAAAYGGLTLFEATRKAYGAIFGATPNDAKVSQLLNGRIDYLAWFGNDGAEGIGTKAAMVGFLLASGATENVGVLARSNDAWLADLADGSAPFAVNILDPANGYYRADFVFGGT